MSSEHFADDVIDELLKRTEKGEPLTRLCDDPRMPSRRSVYDWIRDDPEFASRFHAARAQGVHALVDVCLEIADKDAADAVRVADKRLKIDTRLRLAGKWLPSIYGDKVAHVGGDPEQGDKPIQTQGEVVVRIVRPGDVEPA